MILQIGIVGLGIRKPVLGPGGTAGILAAGQVLNPLLASFLKTPFVSLQGALSFALSKLFRTATTERLSKRSRLEAARANKVAAIRGEGRAIRFPDPFSAGFLLLSESQLPVAPQLALEFAVRKELARNPIPFPPFVPQPGFTPGQVGQIQQFFGGLPPLDPFGTLAERKATIAAQQATPLPDFLLGVSRRARVMSGLRSGGARSI